VNATSAFPACYCVPPGRDCMCISSLRVIVGCHGWLLAPCAYPCSVTSEWDLLMSFDGFARVCFCCAYGWVSCYCYCYCCIPYWFVCDIESNYSNLTELFERESAGVEALFMQGRHGAADISFFVCEDVCVLRMSTAHVSTTDLH
jgi:hypothetical protein